MEMPRHLEMITLPGLESLLGFISLPLENWLDVTAGPGRMQDIELLAQTGALLGGLAQHDIAAGLAALNVADADSLTDLHHTLWCLQVARRLVAPNLSETSDLGRAASAFLAAQAGLASLEDMQETLESQQTHAAEVISDVLTRLQGPDTP